MFPPVAMVIHVPSSCKSFTQANFDSEGSGFDADRRGGLNV